MAEITDRSHRSSRDDHRRHDDRGSSRHEDRYSRGGDRERSSRGGEERYSSHREHRGDRNDPRGGGERGGYASRDDRGYRRHEDDRRPPRDARPPRDDAADGGRRGRGKERENPGGFHEGRRSPTPPGCVPLSQRKRKASGWDVHAPGYEQYSAMQAKQTGLFNLPGANRTQMPPILSMPGLPQPMPVQQFGMGMGINPGLSRQSRRLYIGSITPDINEQNLTDFFNEKMAEMKIGTGGPGNPVLAVQCNYEKNYAFVEFRSAEDATAAMAFDGIIFINGPLKIRRPKDYGGMETGAPYHVAGAVSTNVPDSEHKIFIGGLPAYINEEQVMDLLKSFGELKAFNLVREPSTGASKGFAFVEYVDPEVTNVAIEALAGMEIADKTLVAQLASVGAKQGTIPEMPQPGEIPRPIMPAGDVSSSDARIVLMLNMVTPEDLIDDAEYAELVEDIRSELDNYGAVEDLRIPRPVRRERNKWGAPTDGVDPIVAQRQDEAAGVGRVYVKYRDGASAGRAMQAIAGRSFGGRTIIVTLLSEDMNVTPPLELIFAPQPEAPPPLPAAPAQ
ncbi:unnamed protein product [Peniophora sp. CBMAI 1063]|nr:unnamed protein product [Peniophora sp. CBMAI 1063]